MYDPERDETRSMRGKEDAMDYRYFPDPDLLPLAIANDWIERVRRTMPELPGAMRERFEREYGLSGLRRADADGIKGNGNLLRSGRQGRSPTRRWLPTG